MNLFFPLLWQDCSLDRLFCGMSGISSYFTRSPASFRSESHMVIGWAALECCAGRRRCVARWGFSRWSRGYSDDVDEVLIVRPYETLIYYGECSLLGIMIAYEGSMYPDTLIRSLLLMVYYIGVCDVWGVLQRLRGHSWDKIRTPRLDQCKMHIQMLSSSSFMGWWPLSKITTIRTIVIAIIICSNKYHSSDNNTW